MAEENTQVMQTEDTPLTEVEQNTSEVEETTTTEADTTPQTEQTEATETDSEHAGVETETAEPPAPFLTIKYNHESKGLTENEARTIVQKSMKNEPILDKVRYLAARNGCKNIAEFVNNLVEAAESSRRAEIESASDDKDIIEAILKADREKYSEAAGVILKEEEAELTQAQEDEAQRIADDLSALSAEFSEIKSINDVPDTVLKMAVEKKISLLDAYLRFQRKEQIKIKQAEEAEKKATESTAGTVESDEGDTMSPEVAAMHRGFGR